MLYGFLRRRCWLTYMLVKLQVNKRSCCKTNVRCAKFAYNFLTPQYKLDYFYPVLRNLCNESGRITGPLTPLIYDQVCNETLDSLAEYFEELIENAAHLKTADVSYSDGVLTVHFGVPYGTYVINRQTPNLQIWLSSPTSGPKRYDFQEGCWVYRHDGISLHEQLNNEIPDIVKQNVDFFHCSYAKSIEDNK